MSNRFFYCIVLFLSNCVLSYGQSFRRPGPACPALGAYSTQQPDVFSFINNQAALMQLKTIAAGIYSERRFMLTETSMYTAALAMPAAKGNFGLDLTYMGFSNYNESKVGIAYARHLGEKADIGIQFNYCSYAIPGYTGGGMMNFELGALLHLTEDLNAGIHIYNPVKEQFSKADNKMPARVQFGLGYDASDLFFIGAEIEKEEDMPVNLNAGFQYRFAQQLFARFGMATATSTSYAAIGVAWNDLRLDASASYHPQLGLSPGLMLIMNFGKRKSVASTIQ